MRLNEADKRFRSMTREQQRDDLLLRRKKLREDLDQLIADFPDDPTLPEVIREVERCINTPISDAHPN
jgi:hypothetical protein